MLVFVFTFVNGSWPLVKYTRGNQCASGCPSIHPFTFGDIVFDFDEILPTFLGE